MKIKISDIKNDINMPDFPSILLIDLERESKFNTFTNLNNELPNFSKKILSSEANKLLEQLFFYANEKNEILTINTIGINTLKIPTNEFSKTMKEELRYISQFYNKFTFVISTTNYNSMELHSIAKWSEENDKLYFVSIKNEEEYNQLVLNKFNNVIVLKSSKFPYEAEAIAVDIHHMFIHSEFVMYINDIIENYNTLSGETLNSKLYALFFKNILESEILNIINNHSFQMFNNKTSQYSMNISDYHEIIKSILNYTLLPFNKYFYIYPAKFDLSYKLIPVENQEGIISISFEMDGCKNCINIEF